MKSIQLNDGAQIPAVGFGVCAIGAWQQDDDYVVSVILKAIEVGYRHFDTASLYGNERSLGKAIKASGLPRSDFFISTKVWDSQQGYDETLKAFDESLARLDMDYVDLYLVHWPIPEKTQATWQALEKLHEQGRVRSLGLSNFRQSDIEQLMAFAKVKPVYNQLEVHPYLTQTELSQYCETQGIVVSCWSPLGSGTWNATPVSEKPIADPVIQAIADRHGVTTGQIILKWDVQQGRIVIPKAESEKNIVNNFMLDGFELTAEEINTIDGLNKNHRYGADPDTATADNLKMIVPD